MQTRALKTLLEIDRVGSFASAAEHLNMTLSAVSMQMKALEAELGVGLFDRAYRPPKLTPVGRAVAAAAGQVVGAEDALLTACRPSGKLSGVFRIGFVPTASIRLLPGFLRAARDQAPDARFDIETGLSDALEDRLLSGRLDYAVVTASQMPAPGLTARLLREEPLVYVAPAAYAELHPNALFATLPFFHFLSQSGIGKLIARHVADHKGAMRNSIFLDSVEAIMECVNAGLGFTILPEPDIRRHVGAQSQVVDPTAPVLTRRLILASTAKGAAPSDADQIAALFEAAPGACAASLSA